MHALKQHKKSLSLLSRLTVQNHIFEKYGLYRYVIYVHGVYKNVQVS